MRHASQPDTGIRLLFYKDDERSSDVDPDYSGMHNYTTYEEHVRYVELPQPEQENHPHDKEGTASDVLEPKKERESSNRQ